MSAAQKLDQKRLGLLFGPPRTLKSFVAIETLRAAV
jgi:hypothetical protein